MKLLKCFTFSLTILVSCSFFSCKESHAQLDDKTFVNYVIEPKKSTLKFYWKTKDSNHYYNFANLREELQKHQQDLVFAVNGGMFKKDFSPQGLYIENGKTMSQLDIKNEGYGNFYLQPNGVFYLNQDQQAFIVTTQNFKHNDHIAYATQSGPMLLIDGDIHNAFKEGSTNLNIRNGVGILPDGSLLFAMSKDQINFYDFASYFKRNGCLNALYLDGFVSKTYLPSKNWEQLNGKFGVIIAVTKPNN